jgi:hypothetical protein
LGAVLSPAEQIYRGVRHFVTQLHRGETGLDAAATSSFIQDQAVATVAIGAEQFGVEDGNLQHGSDLAIQSWNAV